MSAATSLTFGALPDPFVYSKAQYGDHTRFESLVPYNSDYTRFFYAAWTQQVGNMRREVFYSGTESMVVRRLQLA